MEQHKDTLNGVNNKTVNKKADAEISIDTHGAKPVGEEDFFEPKGQLAAIWPIIKKAIEDGFSLIPVYDKTTIVNGRECFVKSPCIPKWKLYQTRRLTESQLYDLMVKYNTTAVGVVCGKISGNKEVIDVDVKYNEGFGSILFKDIKELYPELWEVLKINKTPSGGYHIIYRVTDYDVPGSAKLAGRESTAEELALKPKLKTKNFLETKAEGGYVLLPPSGGYSSYKNDVIPNITWEQRCSLIILCQSYDQVKKIVKLETTNKGDLDYFDEDPFTHFNKSDAGRDVLLDYEWRILKESNKFIWYTRPGKTNGISASYNKESQCFYVFTSSTEFDPEKGYNPSTALAILKFNNDKKATFSWLTNNGYGKVNPKKELLKVERLARSGIAPPENFSESAKAVHADLTAKLLELHPFGTYWQYDPDDRYKLKISREALMRVAVELGFRLYRGELIQINGRLLNESDERGFQDVLKQYIKEPDEDEKTKIYNVFEAFMQRNGQYTITRLEIIDEENINKDTATHCYKFFKNGFVEITANGITCKDYTDLNGYVFSKKIQQRDYSLYQGGKYLEYLKKATNWETQSDHVKRVIGYLSHEYKDETTGYIIVLTEECKDSEDGGGSGKNVFCNLLSYTTTYHSKNGAQAKFDEKFFQSWNGQKIMGISDIPKNFNFLFLKEPSTGTFILKKLFKDEVEIPVCDGPKFVVQTNYSYENTDGGLLRRIVPVEFTDFFTRCGGIDVHFGCHFPNGWCNKDWHGFDTLIIESIELWLKSGRKLTKEDLSETGWVKQFEFMYGVIYGLILENIDAWCEHPHEVDVDRMHSCQIKYFTENNIAERFRPSPIKINKALRAYCKHHNIEFKSDCVKRIDTINTKRMYYFKRKQ